METAGYKRKSRRQEPKRRGRKDLRASHFQTVWFGGFEESQMICYLWDAVKSMEAVESVIQTEPERSHLAETDQFSAVPDQVLAAPAGLDMLKRLEKEMRRRIRVEMRRYFLRKRRRNVKMIVVMSAMVAGISILLGGVVGIDRVSGSSMYPYLMNGDWVVYSRINIKRQRDDVVVFEKNGESYVKRVAGLPGDTVEISASGGRVVINGELMKEHYVTLTDSGAAARPGKEENRDQMGTPQTVMNGQYLVLGDNRSESVDSRDSNIGTVPEENVLGNVVLVVRMKRE